MESRIRSIFLTTAVTATFLSLGASNAWAQDSEAAPEVIDPAVERRDIDVAAIDTEDFEVTAFFGLMSEMRFRRRAEVGNGQGGERRQRQRDGDGCEAGNAHGVADRFDEKAPQRAAR